MKNDADTIRSFLLGLLEYFGPTEFSPSGKVDSSGNFSPSVESASECSVSPHAPTEENPNPLEDELLSTFNPDITVKMPPISELGELPAVQDHFQAVLKRRLQIEIIKNPPLFPWESNLKEYPVEFAEASSSLWLAQLRSLQLPITLPEDILAGLLDRCQAIVAEALQPGVQLVKAVENLFPDQPQAMDQIAGLVLANATVRSVATRDLESLKAAFPEGYEGANPQQQVTLTMLAAKEILDALTVNLTTDNPTGQRQWSSLEGEITLTAHFAPGTPNQINIAIEVPQASQVSLPTVGQTVSQNRPGILNLTLMDPALNVAYPLEVNFSDFDAAPLTFIIRWQGETY